MSYNPRIIDTPLREDFKELLAILIEGGDSGFINEDWHLI